jgi:hypothetical protein
MPLTTLTCLSVNCDACGTALLDDNDGHMHFTNPDDSRVSARAFHWLTLADDRFLCPERNTAHQAVIDELMPAEPQPDAQLTFEATEQPHTGDGPTKDQP